MNVEINEELKIFVLSCFEDEIDRLNSLSQSLSDSAKGLIVRYNRILNNINNNITVKNKDYEVFCNHVNNFDLNDEQKIILLNVMTFSYAKESNASCYYKILKEVNKVIKYPDEIVNYNIPNELQVYFASIKNYPTAAGMNYITNWASGRDDFTKNQIYLSYAKILIDKIVDLKSFVYDNILEFDDEMLIETLAEFVEIETYLNEVYNNNNLKQIIVSQIEDDDKYSIEKYSSLKHNVVVFSTKSNGTFDLLADLKNIPQEHYKNIIKELFKIKNGIFTNEKRIQRHAANNSCCETKRSDSLRIIYRLIAKDTYVILGAFKKEATNDEKQYDRICEKSESITPYDIADYLSFAEEKFNYVLEELGYNKHKIK